MLLYVTLYVILYLFNDAARSSDYIASYGKTTNEWWIGRDVEGYDRGLICDTSTHFQGRRKPTKILSYDIRFLGQDSNKNTSYKWQHLANYLGVLLRITENTGSVWQYLFTSTEAKFRWFTKWHPVLTRENTYNIPVNTGEVSCLGRHLSAHTCNLQVRILFTFTMSCKSKAIPVTGRGGP
jgi:hypothetical protein